MSEHTKYASAQASASKSRSEYSPVAFGEVIAFGAIVGLAGVHVSSSPLKLDTMKNEALLDPIGRVTNERGKPVKYYDQDYIFNDADWDGAPLAETRATIEAIKQEVMTTCVNPLPGIQADGLLAKTSKSCSSEI